MPKILLVFLVVVIAVVGVTILNKDNLPNSTSSVEIAPSSFPYEELTIPYLRSREYKSTLSDLELISQGSSYNSYFTSYISDGLKINDFLTKPNGNVPEGGFPAIVFIHGYIAPTQYKTLSNYATYVDYLAKSGFVVFKIDLRGHGDSEGSPGGAYYSSDYVIDALNARAVLSSADFVNSDKVGFWGHSMAGNVVFKSFAVAPDIPAVVIWAGAGYSYADLREFGLNDDSYRPPQNDSERQRKRRELFEKYGEFSGESDFWKQVAPTNYVSDLKGAIQIHHALDDNVVDVGYSRGLMSTLDKTNIPHELFEYQNGGHNLSGESFNSAMLRTVDFFKKYL